MAQVNSGIRRLLWRRRRLLLVGGFVAAFMSAASGLGLAHQHQPIPRVGACPLGYYISNGYCVPGSSGVAREAIQRIGNTCPLGWYTSGSYCVKSR